nr:K155 [uncultured bacterium]
MNDGIPATADLVVIGAGVVGLACAFRAIEAGLSVVVLEQGAVGTGASGVAAGMLSPALEVEDSEPALIAFARDSMARYPGFVAAVEAAAGLACGYRSEGSLWLALDRDDHLLLERLYAIQREAGLSTRLLPAPETRQREPNITPRTVAGLFAPDDHQVDPRRLVPALAAAIRRRGGNVVERAADARVLIDSGRAGGVAWADRRIAAGAVLLAAGSYSNALLPAGCAALPLRPVKGQTVRLRGPRVIDHVVRTPRVYLVPREDGEIVIGATMEELGFDARATVWAVHDLLAEARRAVPSIDELAIAELPVGFRPALRDGLPAIGAYGPAGLFVATGHYRHGILLAVATADLMLTLLTGARDERLAAFDPHRFAAKSGAGHGDRAERHGHDGRRSAAG